MATTKQTAAKRQAEVKPTRGEEAEDRGVWFFTLSVWGLRACLSESKWQQDSLEEVDSLMGHLYDNYMTTI